jgi:hypothetical protein
MFPYAALTERTLAGSGTPSGGLWLTVASAAEELANIGIWLAFMAIYVAVHGKRRFPECIALAFALFGSMLGREDILTSAYATGRTLSPMLVALGAAH